jgi:hypothetical protein
MRTSRAWAALLFALLLAATAMAPVARATQSDRWIEQREDDPFAFGDPDGSGPGSPQSVQKTHDTVLTLGRLRLALLAGRVFTVVLVPVSSQQLRVHPQ